MVAYDVKLAVNVNGILVGHDLCVLEESPPRVVEQTRSRFTYSPTTNKSLEPERIEVSRRQTHHQGHTM